MSEKAVQLAEILSKQDEILTELRDVTVRQREALKTGRHSDLQALMSDLRHVSVRSQAIEAKRMRAAEDLANDLGCEATVTAISGALGPEDAAVVTEAADKLIQTVSKLKTEMSILGRLMEEAKMLNDMLISEWRRIGEKTMGMGSFDTRI